MGHDSRFPGVLRLDESMSDTAIQLELGTVIKPELGNVIAPRHRDEYGQCGAW